MLSSKKPEVGTKDTNRLSDDAFKRVAHAKANKVLLAHALATPLLLPSAHISQVLCFHYQLTDLGLLAPTVEEVKDGEDTLTFDVVEPTQASPDETHDDDCGDEHSSDNETHAIETIEIAEDNANMEGLTSLVDAIASDAAME